MPSVNKSVEVPFSAAQMFALVYDMERYPEFVSWCESAEIIERTDTSVTARLLLSRGGAQNHYDMRNSATSTSQLDMDLLDGPFNYFRGRWRFDDVPDGSHMELDVGYQYANPLLGFMFDGPVRDRCKELVSAFAQRAHEIYG